MGCASRARPDIPPVPRGSGPSATTEIMVLGHGPNPSGLGGSAVLGNCRRWSSRGTGPSRRPRPRRSGSRGRRMPSKQGCLAIGRAVDVGDGTTAAGPAHDVVVIVPDTSFEPGRAMRHGSMARRIESRRGERVEGVVHGLKGDMAYPIAAPRRRSHRHRGDHRPGRSRAVRREQPSPAGQLLAAPGSRRWSGQGTVMAPKPTFINTNYPR